MISLKLARLLGFDIPSIQTSLVARLRAIVFPCASGQEHIPATRIKHLDGSEVHGRLHEVDIRWCGEDEERSDQYIFIRPQFLTTKVRVMKELGCDVVFSFHEIRRKRLNVSVPLVGGILPKPDKANKNPAVYQAHLAEKDKIQQLKSQRANITSANRTQQVSTASTQRTSTNNTRPR